jgi:hypothetical protein
MQNDLEGIQRQYQQVANSLESEPRIGTMIRIRPSTRLPLTAAGFFTIPYSLRVVDLVMCCYIAISYTKKKSVYPWYLTLVA